MEKPENYLSEITRLKIFSDELEGELSHIADYWKEYTPDTNNGGFYGKLNDQNQVFPEAEKGSILNCRILWTFSSAYLRTNNHDYFDLAQRSYEYIVSHFEDKEFGGIYWSVDYLGKPLDKKKQIYAIAFAIYGLSEYYNASKNKDVLTFAVDLYTILERYSFDHRHGGYFEAFAHNWKAIDNSNSTHKYANASKSMYTHLHILEAYTNLYKVWKNRILGEKIRKLIRVFIDHIIDPSTNHLHSFFDADWKTISDFTSFGHEIEASWLILEAAETLKDKELIEEVKIKSVKIAVVVAEGLEPDGGLIYEPNQSNPQSKDKHWWVQAEAIIGFFNAYQISQEPHFLDKSIKVWEFVKDHIIDKTNGEWLRGVASDYSLLPGENKVGPWKCPYHNSRACLEIVKRIHPILVNITS